MFGNASQHCHVAERRRQVGMRRACAAQDTKLNCRIEIIVVPGALLTGVDPLHHKRNGRERHFRG